MPLYKRQPFVREPNPPGIKPDDKVFYCAYTGEIFLDYEKFFDKVVLCNALQWSCSVTGRPGLTFDEAASSERRAMSYANTLPPCLKRMFLFLMSLTQRTILTEANDEVFSFIKQRFFVGESVEVAFRGEKRPCSVISVKLEEKDEGVNYDKPQLLDPDWYSYVVKEAGEEGEPITVKCDRISRKKTTTTREKCRLFLKLNCSCEHGVWRLKDTTPSKFDLASFRFLDYFAGPVPAFAKLTKKDETFVAKKKSVANARQLAQQKAERASATPKQVAKQRAEKDGRSTPQSQESKLTAQHKEPQKEDLKQDKLAKKEELIKKSMEMKAKKKEEREKEKLKVLEERRKAEKEIMEWNRQRDDLECDDLEPLPPARVIHTRTPNKLFGEMVSILEFVNAFKGALDVDERLPKGITIDEMDSALCDSDMNGPLCDLLSLLLSALFSFQDDEEVETSTEFTAASESSPRSTPALGRSADAAMKDEQAEDDVSYQQLVLAASAASQTPVKCHGAHLKEFPLDPLTVSEVLRLHILGSGAEASPLCIKFRYQQRGGYCSHDDPALQFKRDHPSIIKALNTSNVFDLPPEFKLKILSMLTQQLMTYAALRDAMDEYFEQFKMEKAELKQHQSSELRRDREEALQRAKRRAERRAKENEKQQRRLEKIQELVTRGMSHSDAAKEVGRLELEDEEVKEARAQGRKVINRLLADTAKLDPSPVPFNEHRTRRKGDQFDLHEYDDIEWDGLDPSLLTDQERDLIKSRKNEYEVRRRQEFMEREQQLKEAVKVRQMACSVYPLGRDRYHRTYWVFGFVPGVYVEEPLANVTQADRPPSPREASVNKSASSTGVPMDTSDAQAGPHGEVTGNHGEVTGNHGARPQVNGHCGPPEEDPQAPSQSPMEVDGAQPPSLANGLTAPQQNGTAPTARAPESDGPTSWKVYRTEEEVREMIKCLNVRGTRESALKQALIDWTKFWSESMEGNEDFLAEPIKDEGSGKFLGQQAVVSRNRVMQGLVKNKSAMETMELNLRELLLDIEERVYAGGLGALKVSDRLAWRDAIERGYYNPQDPAFAARGQSNANKSTGGDNSSDDLATASQVVRDLSSALLQIEKSIDSKYLTYPLGNAETKGAGSKKAKKEREENMDSDMEVTSKIHSCWRESLAMTTGISQIFLYLSTLEGSIVWSKSALNARCRLCRRKGDAEKMLLCDKCDKGHHMYCLKPAVKQVPAGDWFCPECRPKRNRAPRTARRSFCEPEESEDSDEEDSEEEEEESSSEEESDSEEEEEVAVNPKVKLLKAFGGGGGSQGSSRASSPVSRGGSKRPSRHATPERAAGRRSRNASPSVDTQRGAKAGGRGRPRTATEPLHAVGRPPAKRPRTESAPELKKKASAKKPGPKSSKEEAEEGGRKSSSKRGSQQSADGQSSEGRKRRSASSAEARSSSSSTANVNGDSGAPGRAQRGLMTDSMKAMRRCEEVILTLDARKDSWPFAHPVSKKDVPDYHRIIKKPMDLSTIKSKINMVNYTSAAEMVADVRLMFKNCEMYNVEDSDIYKAGVRLNKFFETKIKALNLTGLEPKK